jgi:tetratricopeptide (TPR) repeat protein
VEAHLGLPREDAEGARVSAEFQAVVACPEHWQLFELVTEGSTELNAHVKAHVESGCASCNGRLADIQTLERARVMKDEFDAFFDELPGDDAPAEEREKFLSQFKRNTRPSDRLGRLSFDGRQIATEIVKLAGEQGIDAAKARLDAIDSDPARGYALLYAAQLAAPRVSSNPALYVELAKALASASRSLPFLKEKGPAQPVCREQVMGEAQLLESGSLNMLGRPREAAEVARQARVSFIEAGEDSFVLALADYVEGSAESYVGNYASAWRSLRRALDEFQLYGQTNWAGRAEASLGTLLLNRNRNESALAFFEAALTDLHPVQDEVVYAITLSNRAASLLLLRRLERAKASYAKALGFARRLGMTTVLFSIRYGLASIDLLNGQTFKAFHAFQKIALDARAANLDQRQLSAELRVAECLGRLGRRDEMLTRIRALPREIPTVSVECDPAIRELFAQAEAADITSGLIAHVVEYLEARDRGVQKGYKPFRLEANGN